MTLNPNNSSSYKQLYRAAKAKLKLKLRATLIQDPSQDSSQSRTTRKPVLTQRIKDSQMQGNKPSVQEKFTLLPLAQVLGSSSVSDLLSLPLHSKAPVSTNVPQAEDSKRPKNPLFASPCWQVCCNKCDKQVTNAHFHCSICDGGDYDLCETCVNAGAICPGDNHWLIKRSVQNGGFINSTTETVPPKTKAPEEKVPESETSPMPGSFTTETKTAPTSSQDERICNVCIRSKLLFHGPSSNNRT